MRICITVFCCLLFSLLTRGQQTVPEFGKAGANDFKQQAPSFEPDASAVKLFDVTEVEFSYDPYGSKIKTEKRVRIKILKESGYRHASIKIPYYSKKHVSKVKDIKGVVYSFDAEGRVTTQKLEKKDILRDEFTENVATVNFTFPNLRPGSVIEYSYTKIEKDILQLDSWEVQDDIPCLYAANLIVIPEESRLRQKYFGLDSIEHRVQPVGRGREQHTYFRENVRSFRHEPYMTSQRDNLLRVSFLLLPRSNFFIDAIMAPERMWRFFGLQYLQSSFYRKQIDTLLPGTDSLIAAVNKLPSQADRIQRIFQAVKDHRAGKVEQSAVPDNIVEAWKNKNANSAELNLSLLNLLRKANIQSYPLLVSTRTHGQIDADFPSTSQFNGLDVLAFDSTRNFILDATLKSQSWNTPPANVLNRTGLLLDKDTVQWLRLTDDRWLMKQQASAFGCLGEDGDYKGVATVTSHDYAKMLILDSSNVEEEEAKPERGSEVKYTNVSFLESSDGLPLTQQMSFAYATQKNGAFYFFKPQFFTPFQKNPFVSDERQTDIEFGCKQQFNLEMVIDLPPSLTVEFMPKNVVLRTPDSSFFYQRVCSRSGTAVTYKQSFEINQGLFYRESYEGVRQFFQKLYRFLEEEIIFKKAAD